jgi:hypothetical protein
MMQVENVRDRNMYEIRTRAQTNARSVGNVVEAGDAHLPADVERSARVFNPDAMFQAKQLVASRVGLGTRTDLVHVSIGHPRLRLRCRRVAP